MNRKLRAKEMAELLGVSIRTLRNWMSMRIMHFYKIKRVVLFDPDTIEAALKEYERTPKARIRRNLSQAEP
jgi:excisionase family DNA binding protein